MDSLSETLSIRPSRRSDSNEMYERISGIQFSVLDLLAVSRVGRMRDE